MPDRKTVDAHTLPDSAFLYIAPGGERDVEQKTIPRSLRHLAIRDETGALDVTAVHAALPQIAALPGLDDTAKARLHARARTLLEDAAESKTAADWPNGAALDVRALGYRLLDLSEQLAGEVKAMRLLGEETKDGLRIRPEMRGQLVAVAGELRRVVDWAATLDAGEDGKARLALLKAQLALTQL